MSGMDSASFVRPPDARTTMRFARLARSSAVLRNSELPAARLDTPRGRGYSDAHAGMRPAPAAPANEPIDAMSSFSRMRRIRHMDAVSPGVLAAMRPHEVTALAKRVPQTAIRSAVQAMSEDDRAVFLRNQSFVALQHLGPLLDEVSQSLPDLPEGSVGRVMRHASNALLVPVRSTVGDALAELTHRMRRGQRQRPVAVYVVGPDNELRGEVDGAALAAAAHTPAALAQPVGSLQHVPVVGATLDTPVATLLEDVRAVGHRLACIPVLDERRCLRGVLTMQDVVHLAEEASRVTGKSIVAVQGEDASEAYSQLTFLLLIRKRLPWLLALLFFNLSSGAIMRGFEDVLEEHILLSMFIPMLIGMGGNSGSQAGTLLVSALASRDVARRDMLSVLLNELKVGLLLSVPVAVVAFGVAFLMTGRTLPVSLVVALTMLIIVNVSNLVGTLLPFLCLFCKIDPAVVVNPLLTSIIDSLGLVIYFVVAGMLLKSEHS